MPRLSLDEHWDPDAVRLLPLVRARRRHDGESEVERCGCGALATDAEPTGEPRCEDHHGAPRCDHCGAFRDTVEHDGDRVCGRCVPA